MAGIWVAATFRNAIQLYPLQLKIYLKWSHFKHKVGHKECPTLCDPMDCSLSGSSIHGIFQARVLEWIAISFSRGSSRPRNRTRVSCIAGRRFTVWATREASNLTYDHLSLRNRHRYVDTHVKVLLVYLCLCSVSTGDVWGLKLDLQGWVLKRILQTTYSSELIFILLFIIQFLFSLLLLLLWQVWFVTW